MSNATCWNSQQSAAVGSLYSFLFFTNSCSPSLHLFLLPLNQIFNVLDLGLFFLRKAAAVVGIEDCSNNMTVVTTITTKSDQRRVGWMLFVKAFIITQLESGHVNKGGRRAKTPNMPQLFNSAQPILDFWGLFCGTYDFLNQRIVDRIAKLASKKGICC